MSIPQWDYRVEDFDDTRSGLSPAKALTIRLNELGVLGWELVSTEQRGTTTRITLKKVKGQEPTLLTVRHAA